MIDPRTFNAVRHEGRLAFTAPVAVGEYVSHFGEGEELSVTIGPKEEKRSLSQNAYLHAEVLPKFCADTGYTPAQMKLVLLGTYFGWKSANDVQVPEKASTSELKKKEFSDWIDWLIQFGAEQGLNILPPEPDPSRRDPRVYVEDVA